MLSPVGSNGVSELLLLDVPELLIETGFGASTPEEVEAVLVCSMLSPVGSKGVTGGVLSEL